MSKQSTAFSDAWLRPLSDVEARLVWQTTCDVESALARDPALIVELLAILFSETILTLTAGRDQAQAGEIGSRLSEFLTDRMELLIADDAAATMAEIPVAGHA
jgi:hypothetical protein